MYDSCKPWISAFHLHFVSAGDKSLKSGAFFRDYYPVVISISKATSNSVVTLYTSCKLPYEEKLGNHGPEGFGVVSVMIC